MPSAAAGLRRGDAAAIGRLARESQHDAHELLGNQIPETMALAAAACEPGAFAASSFGAGFGGSVWALVAAPTPSASLANGSALRGRMPSVGPVPWFTARPGPPLTELPTFSNVVGR